LTAVPQASPMSGEVAHTYRIPALDVLPDGTLVAA
jgi:hypothetical protein